LVLAKELVLVRELVAGTGLEAARERAATTELVAGR
jgi:hypothetical protein